MVSIGILEYIIPGEVINNYTIGSGIEVNLERHKFDLKCFDVILRGKHA